MVKGRYPRVLIDIWDEYKRDRGSESTRPNKFADNQLYSIIALPHAGVDLESYSFTESLAFSASVSGGGSGGKRAVWREAAEIFEQVTRALAGAEEKLDFEVCCLPYLPPCFPTTDMANGFNFYLFYLAS